jgi:hypothetical protein
MMCGRNKRKMIHKEERGRRERVENEEGEKIRKERGGNRRKLTLILCHRLWDSFYNEGFFCEHKDTVTTIIF